MIKSETRANILLVDDIPANLLALEAVLESPDLNLLKANSGEDALRHLIQTDFAAIILDVMMPEMNGFETAAMIRRRDRSYHTPIIFLTARGKSETEMAEGYAVGAIDYLVKPFVPAVLRSKISALVDINHKIEELRQSKKVLFSLITGLESKITEHTTVIEERGRQLAQTNEALEQCKRRYKSLTSQ